MSVRHLRHGELRVALHELRPGTGLPVLLLHGLHGSAADWRAHGDALATLSGPVFALDFAGHGDSDWRVGGAYMPELFAADADAALAELGPCIVVGMGLGAYVALLLAGARPESVRAAVLLPGPGLDGGGALPDPARIAERAERFAAAAAERRTRRGGTDPLVVVCEEDVRPTDYARNLATGARRIVLVADESVAAPWWRAMRGLPQVESGASSAGAALAGLGALLEREAAR
jgi:pimeloyl-ACP methyl ester carboxylesterase